MNIVFSNVRSLENKLQILSVELAESPHSVWCFTETCLSPRFDDKCLPISTHTVLRADRSGGVSFHKEGGILILIPKCYESFEVGENHCSDAFESIAVALKCSSVARPLYLLCVYRPPSALSNRLFVEEFSSYYSSLKLDSKKVILVGDFNFPQIDWELCKVISYSQSAEKFLEFTLMNSLQQVNIKSTRDRNILDLVLTNDESLIENIEVLEPLGSCDHAQISLVISYRTDPKTTQTNRSYNFYRGDYVSMEKELINIPWEVAFSFYPTIDEKLTFFNDLLHSLFVKYVPLFNTTTGKNIPKPLLEQRKTVRRLYKRSKGIRGSPMYEDYKKQLKIYKAKIKEFFCKTEEKILQDASIRKYWNYVRRKTRAFSGVPSLNQNGICVTDDRTKANLFNDFFCSVFTKDDGKIPSLPPASNVEVTDILFDVTDVFDLLQSQSTKLSCGPDNIPHIIYHKLAAVLACPLYLLYKESLLTGTLPSLWKEANVIPIHKKARPISLTCVACRILERLVFRQIMRHCTENNLIRQNQHGFVRRKSTITQMLECMNLWTKAIEEKFTVRLAYIDFRKAFDSISHTKLLAVLNNKGVRGSLLRWVSNFLTGRNQTVIINRANSYKADVTSGVPQGSVLGPLLFLLFIDDIISVPKHCKIYVYADDCKLFLAFKKNSLVDFCLQRDLSLISDWANNFQLIISVSKC